MWGKLVALVAGLALLTACGSAKDAPDHSSPGVVHQVAVIGDSYASGSDEGGEGPNGWPVLVEKTFDARNLHLDMQVGALGGSGYVTKGPYGGTFGDQVNVVAGVASELVVFSAAPMTKWCSRRRQ